MFKLKRLNVNKMMLYKDIDNNNLKSAISEYYDKKIIEVYKTSSEKN